MSLTDLAAIAGVISGAAVTVSLIYLGLQVHQNTKHTRALIHQGRVARAVGVHLNLAEPHLAEAWIAGSGAVATPEEILRRQFWLIGITYDLNWEDTFLQREFGLLADDQFADYRAHLVDILKHQGLREYFARRPMPPGGPTKFHKFITEVVTEAGAAERAS